VSATANTPHHPNSGLSRIRNWRPLAKQSAATAATAAHFFNTAGAYGAGASLVQTPVQAGYATTPVLSYSSYARFSSDVKSGAIKYPYKWVMYDPEDWSKTPVGEQQNPILYMELFGKLTHAHGLRVVEAPALDLCSVSGTQLPRKSGESCSQWFARVNIAGSAAADGNVFVLQDESNTSNLSVYDSLYSTAAAQARGQLRGLGVLRGVHGQRHRRADDRRGQIDQPGRDVCGRARRHGHRRPVLQEHAGRWLLIKTARYPAPQGFRPGPDRPAGPGPGRETHRAERLSQDRPQFSGAQTAIL
jgi:hypothetical protein